MKKIAVLGGGITGLAAAWRLVDAGHAVELIDAADEAGGLAATFRYEGLIFDYGIHGWFPSCAGNEEIIELLQAMVKAEWLRVQKNTGIYLKGVYFGYPLTAGDLFRSLTPLTLLWCFADFLTARIRFRLRHPIGDDRSFEGWIINRFGRRLYNIYFGPYAYKVWGIAPDLLASDPLLRRVNTVSVWEVLVKACVRRFQAARYYCYSQQPKLFWYPMGGNRAVVDAFLHRIKEKGGVVHLQSRLEEVRCGPDGVREIIFSRSGKSEHRLVDAVISTVPLPDLVRSLRPPPEKIVLEAAGGLRYRGLIFVFLFIARERVMDYQWVYYSESRFVFNRINEFTNIHPSFSASGTTGLCLEITAFYKDELWNSRDEELYASCLEGLKSLGMVTPSDVKGYAVRRCAHGYPVRETDTQGRLKIIDDSLERIAHLRTGGRQGGFAYINMDECVREGIRMADAVIAG